MTSDKIKVIVDEDLEDIIDGYIENRKKEVPKLNSFLENSDFDSIQSIGHNLSGNARSYGLLDLEKIGEELENAAKSKDAAIIKNLIDKIDTYLSQIELSYE